MNISAINTVFFSPTGTSKKVIQAIADGAKTSQPIKHIDLTLPQHVTDVTVAENELTIIAVPVYAGRVAELAKLRLKEVSGNNSPAILVVLYGNREFDDALLELRDIAVEQSFRVVAAAAFIGEHSFSTVEAPTGHGRPDQNDLKIATDLGKSVMQKLSSDQVNPEIQVPGKTPYKDGMPNLPFAPVVDNENCTECEECIAVCPTGSISLNGKIQINAEPCIFCCACVKACPVECISIRTTPMEEKAKALSANCQERKEPQLFL